MQRGITPGLLLGVAFGIVNGMVYGIGYGGTIGPVVCLLTMIGFGLTGSEIETKTRPSQGIRRSAQSACRLSVAMGIPLGIANTIGYARVLGWAGGIGNGLSAGLVGCMTF